MLKYTHKPKSIISDFKKDIHVFEGKEINIDKKTVESFSNEWKEFSHFDEGELKQAGDEYFDIVNEKIVNSQSNVLDLGCGTGRWSYYLAPQVKFIEAVDPSESVYSAANLLSGFENIRITKASIDNLPFENESFDFAFSLGVLHHIPDTREALNKLAQKVKPGGGILIYLYYSLDNKGILYFLAVL